VNPPNINNPCVFVFAIFSNKFCSDLDLKYSPRPLRSFTRDNLSRMDERLGNPTNEYVVSSLLILFQEIQEATASEPLSLDEEYAMQRSWRGDHDKLTFIACLPLDRCTEHKEGRKTVVAGEDDAPERMIGDVNLFLSRADEDEEGCIGELELMIAPKDVRRQGFGRGEFAI
jgi:hypothetical protein